MSQPQSWECAAQIQRHLRSLHASHRNLVFHRRALRSLLAAWHHELEDVLDELPQLDQGYHVMLRWAADKQAAAGGAPVDLETERHVLNETQLRQDELARTEAQLRERIAEYTEVLEQMVEMEDEILQNIQKEEASFRRDHGFVPDTSAEEEMDWLQPGLPSASSTDS